VSGWLVIGLGNPGSEYERTRHNVGFMAVDLLAARMQTLVKRLECRSFIGRGMLDATAVELVKPQTFMNLSGEAARCLLAKEARSIERLIVISDDAAIPFGSLRIRRSGSHGGQNGLRSMIEQLKTQEFARVRIGIGPDHPISDLSRFVLEKFSKKEADVLGETIGRAADAVEVIIRNDIDTAMARFN